MISKNILISATAAGFLLSPFALQAAEPVSNIGITGSHNKYKMSSNINQLDNHNERMPKGGIYYNFGNKMTGEEGIIFQAGVEAKYGKKSDVEDKEAQADLDVGYRMRIDERNYIDGVVGAGYQYNRFDDKKGLDVRLVNKSPFAKAGVGFNHKGDTVLTRLEVGTRYSVEGKSTLKVENIGSETVDLKSKYSPYAELNFMWDKGYNGLPLTAGLYYTQHNYELKDKYNVGDTELKNDEIGLKLGMAF